MRLILISPKFPFENEESRARVIKNYLRELSERHNFEIILVFVSNENIEGKKIPDYVHKFYHLPQPRFFTQVINILIYSVIMGKYPIQSMLFWSARNHRMVKKIVKEHQAEVVMTELIRTTQFRIKEDNILVCDLADLFSIRYRDQLRNVDSIDKIQGQYDTKSIGIFKRLIDNKFIKKLILGMEYRLVRKTEKRLPSLFDATTLVSPVEVKALKELTARNNIFWVPNGTDPAREDDIKIHEKNSYTICFLGILEVPHNEEAVLYFVKEVFPLIKEKIPQVTLSIIGKKPSKAILRACSLHEEIKVLGFVDDLKAEIRKADVFVCPIKSGSGVQTKLFEAMKNGIPIVTASIAAQGIVYQDEEPFMIADDPEEFADACSQLLENSSLRNTYAKRGFDVVSQHYFWENAGNKLNAVIQGQLKD